jgi:hypothetical protein
VAVAKLVKSSERSSRWSVERPSTLQQRFEQSLVGEAVIYGLIAVVLLIAIAWNMPDSAIKERIKPTLTPLAAAVGLEQSWMMFAPDPTRLDSNVEVYVTMDDGSVRSWTFDRDRLSNGMTWGHWQKVKNAVAGKPVTRAGFAHWVVDEVTEPHEKPVRVRVISHREWLPVAGVRGDGEFTMRTLYDETLTGRS